MVSHCLEAEGTLQKSSCPTCSCLSCPDHSRVLKDLSARAYPSSLSDTPWELIAPLLPAPASSAGRDHTPSPEHPGATT